MRGLFGPMKSVYLFSPIVFIREMIVSSLGSIS